MAPRWNPHALIASCGPMYIKHGLEFDVNELKEETKYWYMVIYGAPNGKTVRSISSTDSLTGCLQIPLEAGNYTLTLRIYDPRDLQTFPGISLDDGRYKVQGRQVSICYQPPLERLVFGRRSAFLMFVHHYMYTMLDRKGVFPSAWVSREYLPVGNPETFFLYGVFKAGQSLKVSLDMPMLAGSLIFLTCYNRSSYPIYQAELSHDSIFETYAFTEGGFFLCRVVSRHTKVELVNKIEVDVV
jgi:hypothetical protein